MIRSIAVITFAFLRWALAVSHPVSYRDPTHIPIFRRGNVSDRMANLPKAMDSIKHKYGAASTNMKRSGGASSSNIPITDEQSDTSYSGVVRIGTPAQDLNVVLDTGSSDLWVVTTACTTCPSGVPLFDPSKSSTYENVTSPLGIDYSSGVVAGYVSEDTVALGSFNLQHLRFLSADFVKTSGLQDNLSGIMGLGFQSISVLQTPPFWQALNDQNLLSQPVFGLHLERYIGQAAKGDMPGGTLTLGGTNASLYAGNIEFIGMPNGTTPSYWFQQVQAVTVQGTLITIPIDSGLAAIDTGTTLIGAPSLIAQEIWDSVPGSVPLTDPYQGMYAFPCTTDVIISISFGSTTWAIDAADMKVGVVGLQSGSDQMCAGGIFEMFDMGADDNSIPSWVIGDVFLKNVYSVFQADPPAVGFAHLPRELQHSVSGASSTFRSVGSFLPPASLSLAMFLLSWFFII